MDLQLETLEAIAMAALTEPWLDGGVTYEGDGAPGLMIQTGPNPGQGVAFVTDWSGDKDPLPQDYRDQAHILAFQPQTALALLDRIKELEKRLRAIGDPPCSTP